MHPGRAKYRILEDESGIHDYQIIDAPDIVECEKQ
jgi:hypothetical protein